MNWCKLGRHDDIIFNDFEKVNQELVNILTNHYEFEQNQDMGRYWFYKILPYDNKITIWDYHLDSLLPDLTTRHGRVYTKVCVKCKRIKRNYNMIDIECALISMIGRFYDKAIRHQKAKDILEDRFQ
jgi:hypothetical protein